MPKYVWQAPILQQLNEDQVSSSDSDEEDLFYPPNFRKTDGPTKVIQVPSNEFRKNKIAKFTFAKLAKPSRNNRRIVCGIKPKYYRICEDKLRFIPSNNPKEIRVEFDPKDITVSNSRIILPPLSLRFPIVPPQNESQE